MAEATEDSLGTYTCVPYNALGTMGMSPPATLVLKVGVFSLLVCFLPVLVWTNGPVVPSLQDPPYFNVRPGGEYRQEAGRELVIPCAASGDPDIPTITWRKVRRTDPTFFLFAPPFTTLSHLNLCSFCVHQRWGSRARVSTTSFPAAAYSFCPSARRTMENGSV